MAELSKIQTNTTWSDAANVINNNNDKINAELTSLKSSTTNFKGYFTDISSLQSAFPNPKDGQSAWVGSPYPGTVYKANSGSWTNTSEVPSVPEVELNDYYDKMQVDSMMKLQDDNLKESIAELESETNKINIDLILNDSKYIEYTGQALGVQGKLISLEGYHSLVIGPIACKKGDTFKYLGSGRINAVSYAFYNKGVFVSYGRHDTPTAYVDVEIPEGVDSVTFSSFNTIGNAIIFDVVYVGGIRQAVENNTKDISELKEKVTDVDANSSDITSLLIRQTYARDAFTEVSVENWENGYYSKDNGGFDGGNSDSIQHAKIPVTQGARIFRVENTFVASNGLLGVLFFKDDEVLGVIKDNAQNESFYSEGRLPYNATHIGINSRKNNITKVKIYFDDKEKDTIVITDDNIKDNSISKEKIKGIEDIGAIKSIKDIQQLSDNIANPSNWIMDKYQNGNQITSDTNYQYINIDISSYPVGTIFKCLREDGYNQEFRFAGFFKINGELFNTFSPNVKNITKPDDSCVTLSATVFKGTIQGTEKYGIFINDNNTYVEYSSEIIAEANWSNKPNNKKALARLGDVVTEITKRSNNVLYSKKWASCGDSFSHGDFTGIEEGTVTTIEDGIYIGKPKTYDYLIGNRNNMVIQHMSAGGRTIATPADGSFSNAFSNSDNQTANSNYTQIDVDVDYITLYFGINDSHHAGIGDDGEDTSGEIPIGTIDDETNTTFYGAWNVVIKWIIENRPFAKLGMIISNGMGNDEYRQAEIQIANKWGIPYIDLNGDERTPLMLRSTNPNICDEAKQARLISQRVSETNQHPNVLAHEYESTFIENFLRSL